MKPQIVKILETELVTHNVRRFKLQHPASVAFVPGQAADVSINKPDWVEQKRPFTFTGLPEWEDHLEFTIKIYQDHKGVTNELNTLRAGDELIIHDVFGAIHYAGEGVFIAGGAGVTPFIAIFRELEKNKQLGNNMLLFSNRTESDIILKEDFERMLGNRFINTITDQPSLRYDHRPINAGFIKDKVKNLSQYFYICGPDPMLDGVKKELLSIGVDEKNIITEQF